MIDLLNNKKSFILGQLVFKYLSILLAEFLLKRKTYYVRTCRKKSNIFFQKCNRETILKKGKKSTTKFKWYYGSLLKRKTRCVYFVK